MGQVSFGEPPAELHEHHQQMRAKEADRAKSHPFHRIPPELAHLEKKPPAPKPLPGAPMEPPRESRYTKDVGDLRMLKIKDISVQNKQTELNFNYPEIDLFLAPGKILVDIKYASLNSYDLAKVNKYLLNLSNTKIGLGYEYAGIITRVGLSFKESSEFHIGTKVFGVVNPTSRRGALSTSLILDPALDVVIPIDEAALDEMAGVDLAIPATVDLPLVPPTSQKGQVGVESEAPPLAKFTLFPVLYCRAKQALRYVEKQTQQGSLNLLINGADTNTGLTIVQALASSFYRERLHKLNLVLVVKEQNLQWMTEFTNSVAESLGDNKHIGLVTFDMINDDIVLPGEKTPINYKKLDFFAAELIEQLVKPAQQPVTAATINDYKLDAMVDLIGSRKFLQRTSTRFGKLDEIALPFKSKVGEPLVKLFGTSKESLIAKLLKPKAHGLAFVAMCKQHGTEPSYSVEELYDYLNDSVLSPWLAKWSGNLANSLLGYNYYEEIELRAKAEWVHEGLKLVLQREMRVKVDEYLDWRNGFKRYVKAMQRAEGKVIFRVEDF